MLVKLSLSEEGAKAEGLAPTLDEAQTLLPAKGPGHSSPEELKASSVNAMVCCSWLIDLLTPRIFLDRSASINPPEQRHYICTVDGVMSIE